MNTKNMVAAVALLLGVASSQAGIVAVNVSSLQNLAATLNWQPETPVPTVYTFTDVNWTYTLTLDKPAGFVTAQVMGQHLIGPGPMFVSPVLSIADPGIGFLGAGAQLPDPVLPMFDLWTFTFYRNSAALPLQVGINATQVVPEPMGVALVSGLGLIAFGAYRRVRKS